MAPLAPELRRDLDKAISGPGTGARALAEAAARSALARLGVGDAEAPGGLSPELRGLRTALRERAKALGGGVRALGVPLLVEEIAYEQWHRMLFARFLAENDLLLHPEGAPVSIAIVRELATEEGERDPWVLAARYAAAMLPGIFRADDPANRVAFAPEDRSRLEAVLERLPATVFTADDALGWVYQFWQSERKDEVNKRGDKIGGADLPPVTQLFTEHYMVRFLLENSLGAWWASRHPDSPLVREWEYLRFRDDGTPAAGTFAGWPERAAEVTVMDPCCGSGHFLTAAADMLRRMRMEEERLTDAQAAVAVLRDNLFGLELDARCLQLAAFNLALDAWKAGGYQPLPVPNLACTGIAIKGQRADWHRLAGGDTNMVEALDRLYDLFQDAPELGSLIDPRSAAGEGLWAVDPEELLAKLDAALARETAADPAAAVFGAAAAGTAKAAQLLADRYWLVATNPPFLGLGKMSSAIADACMKRSSAGSRNLATVIFDVWSTRCWGTKAFVLPADFLALAWFRAFRELVLQSGAMNILVRLGSRAFTASSYDFLTCLLVHSKSAGLRGFEFRQIDLDHLQAADMPSAIREAPIATAGQLDQLANPASRIEKRDVGGGSRLSDFASVFAGAKPGQTARVVRFHWEVSFLPGAWQKMSSSPDSAAPYSGKSLAILTPSAMRSAGITEFDTVGDRARGRRGVLISKMGKLSGCLYDGSWGDDNTYTIIPRDGTHRAALASFATSAEFNPAVRRISAKTAVPVGAVAAVHFDLEHWTNVAAERYPAGLPEPHSDDPTQWLFKGSVVGSEAPLQVAVARLLGYRWPDQQSDALDELADADGLVPLVSVSGDRPAAERLRALLARAYDDAWSAALLERLLAEAGSPGVTLEAWLRDYFFVQHTRLFRQRPFIWHVWDGRKDGFSVFCHYHRLDRAKLERLTYTLLGDWIDRQRGAGDEPGADARLGAALALQEKLAAIVEGEAPFDIYVRWKPLAEQPIGWEPDLDDGVRLNIRPFVTAGVLRAKVNVKWDKDRGKNPDGSERINDRHPTLAERRAARAAARKS